MLLELLPIVDNFERALQAPAGPEAESFRKGIELIHKQMLDLLRKRGGVSLSFAGDASGRLRLIGTASNQGFNKHLDPDAKLTAVPTGSTLGSVVGTFRYRVLGVKVEEPGAAIASIFRSNTRTPRALNREP